MCVHAPRKKVCDATRREETIYEGNNFHRIRISVPGVHGSCEVGTKCPVDVIRRQVALVHTTGRTSAKVIFLHPFDEVREAAKNTAEDRIWNHPMSSDLARLAFPEIVRYIEKNDNSEWLIGGARGSSAEDVRKCVQKGLPNVRDVHLSLEVS